MTTNIKELSEKLAQMYNVSAYQIANGSGSVGLYLAEDSGRISDLADDNGVYVWHYPTEGSVVAGVDTEDTKSGVIASLDIVELYASHLTKHDAARMARVRCLIAIGEK